MEKHLTGTECYLRFKQRMPFKNALADLKQILQRLGWRQVTVHRKETHFLYDERRHSPGPSSTVNAPNSWLLTIHSSEKVTWPIQNHLSESTYHFDGDGKTMIWSETYLVTHEILISLPLMEAMTEGSVRGSRFRWYAWADFHSTSEIASFSFVLGPGLAPSRPDPYWERIQSTAEGRKMAEQKGWVKYTTYSHFGVIGADGKMGGFLIQLLPDLCPPLMDLEKLSGSLEAYELMKILVEEIELSECRGVHIYDDSPEIMSIDWQHETGWSQDTLFRFGPGIPNRLIIPLEECRMPTEEEMQDERLDGTAIWSKNVQ